MFFLKKKKKNSIDFNLEVRILLVNINLKFKGFFFFYMILYILIFCYFKSWGNRYVSYIKVFINKRNRKVQIIVRCKWFACQTFFFFFLKVVSVWIMKMFKLNLRKLGWVALLGVIIKYIEIFLEICKYSKIY